MDELIELAKGQLDRVKALCTQVGLRYIEIADSFFGAGIGVALSEMDYVILSVLGGGSESKLMVTCGLAKDIKQDRLAALTASNTFTRNNTIFPVFLHDAKDGWSLLMQLTYTVDLLLDNPEYFFMVVRTTPQVATEHRAELAEKYDLGGQLWRWTPDDLELLLLKSLL
jgi:hypothetical protein